MKKRKLALIPILAVVAFSIVGCSSNIAKKISKEVSKHSKRISLVVDNNTLPKNFRMTNSKIIKSSNLNLSGLSTMNMSGSGALSENGLKLIKQKVRNYHIIDVDLREESHLFVNGIGISWYGHNDDANINLTQSQVISDETNKLNKIKKSKILKIDSTSKKSVGNISSIDNIQTIQTEQQLSESLGIGYIRFAVPDHKRPQDVQVDSFVQYVKELPNNTWLHFHCRGGLGRTTTFMSMYDMMRNAKAVSFNDIMKRQQLIGGANLLSGQDASSKSDAEARTKFLRNFYKYCHNNNDNFNETWTKWIKRDLQDQYQRKDVL